MIRKAIPALAAAMIVSAPAAATTVDFSSAPASFTTYTQSGVTFTASGQTILNALSPAGSSSLLADGSPRSPITALFGSSFTGGVSIDLGDYNSDADLLFLELYSAGNILLASTTLLIDASDETMHTLSLNGVGVSYALFGSRTPSLNGSSVFADNFTFASAGVPEPASWAMMIAGFGMVGAVARRRGRSVRSSVAFA